MFEAAHPVPDALSVIPRQIPSTPGTSKLGTWKPAYWSPRSLALLAAAIVASIVLVYLGLEWRERNGVQQWPVSQGRILAVRTHSSHAGFNGAPVAPRQTLHSATRDTNRDTNQDSTQSSAQPNQALVQADILVSYTAQGHTYMRWFSLPARADLAQDQITHKAELLEGTACTVHWKHQRPLESFVTEYQYY